MEGDQPTYAHTEGPTKTFFTQNTLILQGPVTDVKGDYIDYPIHRLMDVRRVFVSVSQEEEKTPLVPISHVHLHACVPKERVRGMGEG